MKKFTEYSDDASKQEFTAKILIKIDESLSLESEFSISDYNETCAMDQAKSIVENFKEDTEVINIEKI